MTGDDVGLEILKQDVAELVASRATECQDLVSTFLVLYICILTTVDQPGPRSLVRSLSTGGGYCFFRSEDHAGRIDDP